MIMVLSGRILQVLAFLYLVSIVNADNDRYNNFITDWRIKSKISSGVIPIKYNNSLIILSNGNPMTITPMDNEQKERQIPNAHLMETLQILGNGKILTVGRILDRFRIIDLQIDIPNPVLNIDIDNRTEEYSTHIISIATYENTFDIFDWKLRHCRPCRFNDKGQSIKVNNFLEIEPNGKTFKERHRGFSISHINNFGDIIEGYVYFIYYPYRTDIRLLDMDFKILKERSFKQEIRSFSTTYGILSFCYDINISHRHLQIQRQIICEFLDSNLTTIFSNHMYNASKDSDEDFIIFDMISNLPDGGAMVTMDFAYNWSDMKHHNIVRFQHINPDGKVDPPIEFIKIKTQQFSMNDFVFDNGQYCLNVIYDADRTLENNDYLLRLDTKCTE